MATTQHNQLALQDFEQAQRKVFWWDLFSRLTRKCNQLVALDQVRQNLSFKARHYRGLQIVPLDKIVGSAGRYRDFDRAFLPRQSHTKDRWVSIDQAYYEQVHLPPVELVQVGEMYFVQDGNHRVSVARTRGQEFVDAQVTELEVSISVEPS